MKIKEKVSNLPPFIRANQIKIPTYILLVSLVLFIVLTFIASWKIGVVLLLIIMLVIWLFYYSIDYLIDETNKYVSDLSYRIKKGEQEALIQMPIGILLYNEEQKIQWTNPYLLKYFKNKDLLGRRIEDVDAELHGWIEKYKSNEMTKVKWGDRYFEMVIQENIGVLYLMDITDYAKIEAKYQEERIVFGNIIIDNYDEAVQSMNDRKKSNVNNYITNQLTNWANINNVYLKRVDDDRFISLMNKKALERLESNKFEIVDQIRERTYKQNFPLTLSMGFSYGTGTVQMKWRDVAQLAQANVDLALARGGDQVVVRAENEEARFHGGKTNPMEKRTRIRARMISHALEELIVNSDNVFVMGHNYPDMDVIGSCLGIRRIVQMNNKEAWIILKSDQLSKDVKRMMEVIDKDSNISKYIIGPEKAEEMITENSLIVMVDVHKPSMIPAPELMEVSNNVVIIDHHRRGQEFPENPVLVYIEPYASSASELITELFEYQSNDIDTINKIEATAMLAGIIVDTRNFSLRTGSRTFDAASYLQSNGANTLLIQEALKEDLETYLLRSHLLETMDFVEPGMAVVNGEEGKIYDTVLAAQTADTMLSMEGVEASFVITKRSDGRVGISARSLSKINVQRIMEKLGGGGHLSNAATQIEDITVTEAKEKLVKVLKNEDEEGEIK
ncbi:DHH family phosphoesterase [Jeotgalibaca ciconiae]|uniref:Cyclic-di-AMP phosphodiesterase n=1 Tax=Jeotgalibaca ciconiae TaxID=2496265 RepID=A0A3S9HA75_9LACT|nr:DHH family phosphoesterase [Jeotgalibaca ciconiae]AZP04234.1 DHH family phosphoesterase [Jeotgalibaca ciconiae]HJB24468.1 DHH family phosphoesterase [Candidatus Jeotgalibaca pullicola]